MALLAQTSAKSATTKAIIAAKVPLGAFNSQIQPYSDVSVAFS
jgi:hypothetical protein